LFLLFLVFLALLLVLTLLLKNLVDTVLERRRAIVGLKCVPGLHDGVLQDNSDLIFPELGLVVLEVEVVENIVNSDLVLHQKDLTLDICEHFAEVATSFHNLQHHFSTKDEDRHLISAQVVRVDLIFNHERSLVDDRSTFKSFDNERQLLNVIVCHDINVARLN